MGLNAIKAAFSVEAPSSISKAVLLAMASFANPDGTNIWASRATIGRVIQVSPRSVTKGIAELLDAGLLRVTRYGKGGTHTYEMPLKSSVYHNLKPAKKGAPLERRSTLEPNSIVEEYSTPPLECGSTPLECSSTPPGTSFHQPDMLPVNNQEIDSADSSKTDDVYRPVSMQALETSRPVLRFDVDELSEWLWPLEIFDDTKPFSGLECYKGWTERQLRAECQTIPCAFDLYCWRIETGKRYPGQTEGYTPLKGDIGGAA